MTRVRWIEAGRPGSRWDMLGRHGVWAALSGTLLFAACALPPGWLPAIPCWFRALSHRPCPFCGLTRSVRAAGHGQWAEAWAGAPFGLIVFAALAALFVWHAAALLTWRQLTWRGFRPGRRAWTIIALAVLANWLYRWAMGFDRS